MCPAVQTNSLPPGSKVSLQSAQRIPSLTPSNTSPRIGSASPVNPGTSPPPPYIHSHALPSALNPCLTSPPPLPGLTDAKATRDRHTLSGMSALCLENSTAVVPPPGLCASAQIRARRGATLRSAVSEVSISVSASSSTSEAEEDDAESRGKYDCDSGTVEVTSLAIAVAQAGGAGGFGLLCWNQFFVVEVAESRVSI